MFHSIYVWFQDPVHVIAFCTVTPLVISEIMPFLPTKANGILHGIATVLGIVKKAEEGQVQK